MTISTNGGSNPTKVTYNGKNCTEVWFKSSPSAEAVKVWPEEPKKYYLKYLWYPSDGQPKFSTLCIQTWPFASQAGGGTIYAKKNDVDPRWWEMLFWYPNPVELKSAILDKMLSIQFYKWADDNTDDKTAEERYDMLDDRYTDPDHPLLIACWFKKRSEAVSDLPPLPGGGPGPYEGYAYLTQEFYPNLVDLGGNKIDSNPGWIYQKTISQDNPNSMYYKSPTKVPFTQTFTPITNKSTKYTLKDWSITFPDGTVQTFTDKNARTFNFTQEGEYKETSHWEEPYGGYAYLTLNHYPNVKDLGGNCLGFNPGWTIQKQISSDNPDSRYFKSPSKVPFSQTIYPITNKSNWKLEYWTLTYPDGTVKKYNDTNSHSFTFSAAGEYKVESFWEKGPEPTPTPTPEEKRLAIYASGRFSINGVGYYPQNFTYTFNADEDVEITLYNYPSGGGRLTYETATSTAVVASNPSSSTATEIYLTWSASDNCWYAYSEYNGTRNKLSGGIRSLHIHGGNGANHFADA